MKNKFSTGDVSKMFDVSVDTLRYYDKIGILSPMINKENRYRMYDLKELYLLSFILGARYLEISINDIKECLNMEELDFDKYIEFMDKQKKIVSEKIEYLKRIEKTIKLSSEVIKKSQIHRNTNSFKEVQIEESGISFFRLPIESLILKNICKRFSKSIEIENETIEYFTKIEVQKKIDNLFLKGKYIYIEKSKKTEKIIKKMEKIINTEILEYSIKGKIVDIEFLGNEEEIYDYIKGLREFFNIDKGDIFIKIYTFFKSKNEEKSFVRLICKV
ncbi:MAG: MerR family transcriptional regulator [Clostridium sp.]|uniref:helix-turn-helix domain-containing protein n=1 Tax=Clostridium sp. TaxID=1506 RepID=UPI003EE559F4